MDLGLTSTLPEFSPSISASPLYGSSPPALRYIRGFGAVSSPGYGDLPVEYCLGRMPLRGEVSGIMDIDDVGVPERNSHDACVRWGVGFTCLG